MGALFGAFFAALIIVYSIDEARDEIVAAIDRNTAKQCAPLTPPAPDKGRSDG